MDTKTKKSDTKCCTPFNFCAKLALLTAAACGAQCGACEPDITYYTKDEQVVMNPTITKLFKDKLDDIYHQHSGLFKEAEEGIGNYITGETHKWVSDAYTALPSRSEERRDLKEKIASVIDAGDVRSIIAALVEIVKENGEEEEEEGEGEDDE